MTDFARRWFLGAPFTPFGLAEAAALIVGRDPAAPFALVTTPNAQHIVAVARGDRRFTGAHDAAWLVLNDSKILSRLAAQVFHEPLALAAGSDLTAYLFAHHIQPSDSLTIIGGSEEVERRLRVNFHMAEIARYNPPMGFYNVPAEVETCVDFVLAHPARYIFLAVGAPQSELIGTRILARGGASGVGLCIGSSLHFVTGVVARAPEWVRRAGLEAFYRLAQNPRRHFKRVFIDSFPVLWLAVQVRLGLRTHRRAAEDETGPK
jgi:exopolysaccharide biosynthesis WecB/TagA/CpsF family protein